jgi:hypothetical protein
VYLCIFNFVYSTNFCISLSSSWLSILSTALMNTKRMFPPSCFFGHTVERCVKECPCYFGSSSCFLLFKGLLKQILMESVHRGACLFSWRLQMSSWCLVKTNFLHIYLSAVSGTDRCAWSDAISAGLMASLPWKRLVALASSLVQPMVTPTRTWKSILHKCDSKPGSERFFPVVIYPTYHMIAIWIFLMGVASLPHNLILPWKPLEPLSNIVP